MNTNVQWVVYGDGSNFRQTFDGLPLQVKKQLAEQLRFAENPANMPRLRPVVQYPKLSSLGKNRQGGAGRVIVQTGKTHIAYGVFFLQNLRDYDRPAGEAEAARLVVERDGIEATTTPLRVIEIDGVPQVLLGVEAERSYAAEIVIPKTATEPMEAPAPVRSRKAKKVAVPQSERKIPTKVTRKLQVPVVRALAIQDLEDIPLAIRDQVRGLRDVRHVDEDALEIATAHAKEVMADVARNATTEIIDHGDHTHEVPVAPTKEQAKAVEKAVRGIEKVERQIDAKIQEALTAVGKAVASLEIPAFTYALGDRNPGGSRSIWYPARALALEYHLDYDVPLRGPLLGAVPIDGDQRQRYDDVLRIVLEAQERAPGIKPGHGLADGWQQDSLLSGPRYL